MPDSGGHFIADSAGRAACGSKVTQVSQLLVYLLSTVFKPPRLK